MSVSQTRPPRLPEELPPNGLNLAELLQRYREQVDRGFDAISQTIQEQNQQYQRALKLQRRWNYGLLAGLVAVAILAVVLYLRTV